MPNNFLKGLAFAAGTGIAIGIGSKIGRGTKVKLPKRRSQGRIADDDLLRLEPLLNRLDSLESRIETSPVAIHSSLQDRVEQQSRDLAQLRARLEETDLRALEAAQSIKRRFAEVRAEIPALVDAGIGSRMEELRLRLQREMEQHHKQMLESFEAALEQKFSARMAAFESKLTHQGVVLEAMTQQSGDADRSLQRLIVAVERLAEKSPEPETSQDLPFQAHLDRAMNGSRKTSLPSFTTIGPLVIAAFIFGAKLLR